MEKNLMNIGAGSVNTEENCTAAQRKKEELIYQVEQNCEELKALESEKRDIVSKIKEIRESNSYFKYLLKAGLTV